MEDRQPIATRLRSNNLGSVRVIAYPQLKDFGISWSRSHLRRKILAGEFPKPIALSPHRPVWRVTDLDKWLESRPDFMPGSVIVEKPMSEGGAVVVAKAEAAKGKPAKGKTATKAKASKAAQP